ncbi:mitochondrial ribosomal subunit S27-domain-containing protein [Mycena rebaudengoi]|nr:mitochondrial ribosomal subunit S27-domain-containing protein [Mycena rebaudengoi]
MEGAKSLSSTLRGLTRLRCEIFQTSYNPRNLRTGAKYLRARLRGPSMATYYPPRISIVEFMHKYPKFGMTRVADVEAKKRRGKGTPKKAKGKDESRRAAKRR